MSAAFSTHASPDDDAVTSTTRLLYAPDSPPPPSSPPRVRVPGSSPGDSPSFERRKLLSRGSVDGSRERNGSSSTSRPSSSGGSSSRRTLHSSTSDPQASARWLRVFTLSLVLALVLLVVLVHERLSLFTQSPRGGFRSFYSAQTADGDSELHDEDVEDSGVQRSYEPVLINALPYADHPDDSAVTSLHISGMYPDSTHFAYPICTLTRVCTTATHVLLTIHNHTVHSFYRLLIPYCHDVLSRRFELCTCFHYNYRPGLLPYAFPITDRQRQADEAAARRMLRERFGLTNWSRIMDEPIGYARQFPTLEEMQLMQGEEDSEEQEGAGPWTTWARRLWRRVDRALAALGSALSSTPETPRLYPSPFSYPARRHAPARFLNNTSPRTDSTNFSVLHYAAHFWSINKWSTKQPHTEPALRFSMFSSADRARVFPVSVGSRVDHHHIAHWAQKQLVLYASYSQAQHACSRTYRRAPSVSNPLFARRLLQTSPQPSELHMFTEGGVQRRTGFLLDTDLWELECLPPLDGILFHDTWAHPTEHEAHIMQITMDAMTDWIHERKHAPPSRSTPTRFARLTPATNSPPPVPPPSSSSLATNALFADFLYRQYSLAYMAAHRWPVHIPPPVNFSCLSCFDRLSFCPLYGIFVDNAYDFDHWSHRAMEHYGMLVHPQHPHNGLLIPKVSEATAPSLPFHPAPLPAAASLGESMVIAHEQGACPPSRAVLITRPDRDILNKDELLKRLLDKFNLHVDVVAINQQTPSILQAVTFASSGLILSAHSSQMVNVLFSPRSSAMVEIAPELYNQDFWHYARSVGLHFRYAIGGIPKDRVDPGERMMRCLAGIKECKTGEPWCLEQRVREMCTETRHFPNKHKPFTADLDAVERAVRESLGHLLHLCYNRWQHVQLTKLQ